jgi:subtilisin family serine protease
MRRLYRTLLVALVLGTASCEVVPEATAPDSAEPVLMQSKIGLEVFQAVRERGTARVVVALAVPEVEEVTRAASTVEARARLREGVDRAQRGVLDRLEVGGFQVQRRFAMVPALGGNVRAESVLEAFESDPRVLRVDLDVGGTGTLTQSVPFIGADTRHARGNDGEGVVVAVLDTGVDSGHPDLVDDVILDGQACFGFRGGSPFCYNGTDRDFDPGSAEDDAGHGTHVSGIVSSNGTQSGVGVAPEAGILAIKVLDNCSLAGCFYSFMEIVAAFDYIIANNDALGVSVINLSLGTGTLFTGVCDATTSYNMAGSMAVNTLRSMGVLTVASAGNNGSTTRMSSPACLQNVMSVGASDLLDIPAGFTNSNSETDIFAPGVNTVSARLGGGTLSLSGTSMAAPHVAGCAALLIDSGQATAPADVQSLLEASPFSVVRAGLTFPRLDCTAPPNQPPSVGGGEDPVWVDEGSLAENAGTVSDPNGDDVTLTASVGTVTNNGDGTWSWSWLTSDGPSETQTVTIAGDDGFGGSGEFNFLLEVANVAPSVDAITLPPEPVFVSGPPVVASATFSDPAGTLDAHTCTVDYGDGAGPQAGTVTGLTCVGPGTAYAAPGLYTITMEVVDKDGGVGMNSADLLVVDADAGSVTGGGWIQASSGNANFGFVVRYPDGALTPDGNMTFKVRKELDFKADTFDWLLVDAGAGSALFRGAGTVNGSDAVEFQVWAGDGPDAIRVRIWEDDGLGGENVLFDNLALQDLGGGSIQIHTQGNKGGKN